MILYVFRAPGYDSIVSLSDKNSNNSSSRGALLVMLSRNDTVRYQYVAKTESNRYQDSIDLVVANSTAVPKRRRKLLSLISLADNHYTEGKNTRLALIADWMFPPVIDIRYLIRGRCSERIEDGN
jgi:hypothetical protein